MNISFFLLPKSEVAYVNLEDTIGQALDKIQSKGFQSVPVIDREGRYTGTVTEGDFLRALSRDYNSDFEAMKKDRISTLRKKWNNTPVSIDAKVRELDKHIVNQNFVPVVDSRGIFVGIVTRKTIITELLRDRYGEEEKAEVQPKPVIPDADKIREENIWVID